MYEHKHGICVEDCTHASTVARTEPFCAVWSTAVFLQTPNSFGSAQTIFVCVRILTVYFAWAVESGPLLSCSLTTIICIYPGQMCSIPRNYCCFCLHCFPAPFMRPSKYLHSFVNKGRFLQLVFIRVRMWACACVTLCVNGSARVFMAVCVRLNKGEAC